MKKTVNMTIRIDPDLKAKAEEACEYLDLTLSRVMRAALQNVVRDYYARRIKDTEYARFFNQGDLAERAQAALERELQQEAAAESQKAAKRVVAPTLNDLVRNQTSVQDKKEPEPPKVDRYARPKRYENGPRINEDGEIDPATLTRKMRRAWERDKAKGRI